MSIVNQNTQVTAGSNGVETPSCYSKQSLGQLLRNNLGFLPVLFTLIIIAVFFQITTHGLFLTPRNLTQLILQITTIGTLGLGVVLVLLLGEIDLSVAAVATLCSVVMGMLSERLGYPAWIAISAAIATGAMIGFINGFFIAYLRVPSFIVTLAASISYSGLLIYLLQGQATLIINNDFIIGLANNYQTGSLVGIGLPVLVLTLYIAGTLSTNYQRRKMHLTPSSSLRMAATIGTPVLIVIAALVLFHAYLGVPQALLILASLILLCWLLLTKTPYGRHVYAVGGNTEAARRAGIHVVGIRITIFTLCSTLAAIAGILATSRASAVASQINPTLLLQAIAAAVIGGVSLFGGRGSVWSIVLGALIIGSLGNGLDLNNQPVEIKQMIEGAVLLLAVTSDALIRRAQTRTGR
ncbi:sugar ABC transporter permease [Dictyobacter arantiisoli]|uniref:Xylose transport system permease protein XylH n=1 Tax=Dictyobacter arantiisoli TaxID=2014874 RepID=A0A5A5TGT9_9CHLR|nr:inner-membrane translocator [Dictyobacter arantiisoli]GCF10577.1 ABC transporter permease [Dictyobacter arantiisoli]